MNATYTTFAERRLLASGALQEVAVAAKRAYDQGAAGLVVFDDATGRPVDLDFRGGVEDVRARLNEEPNAPQPPPTRGRPRLGVTAREVTLLPSQWEWLAGQPGGASAALRRLVDQARRSGPDLYRQAQEAAHRVMFALAGDLPGFEEANRAFYGQDDERFEQLTDSWPVDVRDYVRAFARRVAAARS